jgi:hypothetical protein
MTATAEYLAGLRLACNLYMYRPGPHQLRVATRHVGFVSQSGEPVYERFYLWSVIWPTVSRLFA